jgi:WD40 repeat protein
MLKLFVLIALLLTGTGVFAQVDTPVALVSLLQAGDFQAVEVTNDEQYLLVADAATNQVRVYELSNPNDPQLVSTVDVDGSPTDLAAGRSFNLVATRSSESPGTIEVIAPDRYTRGEVFAGGVNYVDLPFEISELTVSPDRSIAIAYGEGSFALLELNSAEEISTRIFSGSLSHAVLTNDLVISADGATLTAAQLNGLRQPTQREALDLAAAITALAVSPTGTAGAAGLANGTILLFDPSTLEEQATFSLSSAASILQFGGDAPYLIAVSESGGFDVLDASNQQLQSISSQSSRNGAIRALTTFGNFIVTANDSEVAILSLP